MSFRQYTFSMSDLEVGCQPQLTEDEIHTLVSEIFESWSSIPLSETGDDNAVKLKATLQQHTEGQSPAEVYELVFFRFHAPFEKETENPSVDKSIAARFIIRAHFDPSDQKRNESARREIALVGRIENCASDFFSSHLQEGAYSVPGVVVYRHADDQFESVTMLLRDAVKRALRSHDTKVIEQLASGLGRFIKGITSRLNELGGDLTVIAGTTYLDRIESRLAPDLLIDARVTDAQGRKIEIDFRPEDGTICIKTKYHEAHPDDKYVEQPRVRAIVEDLNGDPTVRHGWLRLNAFPTTNTVGPGGHIRFTADGSHIWLRLHENHEINLENKKYNIYFKYEEGIAIPGSMLLLGSGFEFRSYLLRSEFSSLCKRLKNVHRGLRHMDLHGRNVLTTSEGSMKAIDLLSILSDLIAVGEARLEVSLWDEITREFPDEVNAEDAETVLQSLVENQEISIEKDGWMAWALHKIFVSLRYAAKDGRADTHITDSEVALAYTSQILFHQRYYIENFRTASAAFNVVTRHWIERFERSLDDSLDEGQIATGMSRKQEFSESQPRESSPVDVNYTEDANQPTLNSLWRAALSSPHLGDYVEDRPKKILESFVEQHPSLMQSALTELQQNIWESCSTDRPFHSQRHIILTGPTSCGKSTVAEMFLAGPPLLNGKRKCAIYIAPTRALTQAKHRELKKLFHSDKKICAGIVLSTGEDGDHDWQLAHGQFDIACMVYEKANILFSQNRQLLDHLGCIVIDETHMLMDRERGPSLEMVLTKALRERREIDMDMSHDPNKETLRVVAISTEERASDVIKEFYSVYDVDNSASVPPLEYHADSRPVTVQHWLVLPADKNRSYDNRSYYPHRFLEFADARDRMLSKERLIMLDEQLTQSLKAISAYEEGRYHTNTKREVNDRLNDLLVDLLRSNPRGYRALVFVPSRREAEQVAQRLKNSLSEKIGGKSRVQSTENGQRSNILRRIDSAISRSEEMGSLLVNAIKGCARVGIFIHHADVERKVREEVEDICSKMEEDTLSQVIFATETLSYGINLAINDVILCGTEFYSQPRLKSRLKHVEQENLSVSSFHNMIGRAGRFKVGKSNMANVYILVPLRDHDGHEIKPFNIIQTYYSHIKPLQSMLYTSADMRSQINTDRYRLTSPHSDDQGTCARYAGLKAVDFTYPFVRSVLDALRHLNLSSRSGGSNEKINKVSQQHILEFFSDSLYVTQSFGFPSGQKKEELFTCAVERVLDNCSEPPLELIEAEIGTPTHYAITARGEAIIDTGTEIETVEPLLQIKEQFHAIWYRLRGEEPFATEIYLLCLLAQSEIHRQNIYNAPECPKRDAAIKSWHSHTIADNRQFVFNAFKKSLNMLGVPLEDDLAEEIRNLLENWEPLEAITEHYPKGATDSLLRLFNGLISWINGEERSTIEFHVEGPELEPGHNGQLTGFRRLTEQLSYKALFLAKMLATAKSRDAVFTPDNERNLYMLASRLRLGCTTEAIPLFWPHSSDMRRQDAVKVLSVGITPGIFLSMENPRQIIRENTDIPDGTIHELHHDLELFAAKQFKELEIEIAGAKAQGSRRIAVQEFWKKMSPMYEESIAQFRRLGGSPLGFNKLLKETLQFSRAEEDSTPPTPFLGAVGAASADDSYRIRVEFPAMGVGVLWHGEVVYDKHEQENQKPERHDNARQSARQHSVKVIAIEFYKDWRGSTGGDTWMLCADLIASEQSTPHLAIVCLPWTPLAQHMPAALKGVLEQRNKTPGFSTVFLTAAAYGVMLSTIVRDFVSGESFMKDLTAPAKSLFSSIGIKDVSAILDRESNAVPSSIRTKLIQHFEVDVLPRV